MTTATMATAEATSPAAEVTSAAPAEGPGTITLTSSAITGQASKVLLVFALPAGGGERLARACVQIPNDDYSVPSTIMSEVPEGDDPCGGTTDAAILDEGSYTISAGVYVGGQQTPDTETSITVDVSGNVSADLPGDALSAE